MKGMTLTRDEAILILLRIIDKDDPYWENIVDDWYDKEEDNMPFYTNVLNAFGITDEEIKKFEHLTHDAYKKILSNAGRNVDHL